MEHSPGKQLDLNDVAEVTVSLNKNVPFMSYQENKNMGSMIIIDPISNQTIGVGMINFALRRAQNIHLQSLSITKELREKMNGTQRSSALAYWTIRFW